MFLLTLSNLELTFLQHIGIIVAFIPTVGIITSGVLHLALILSLTNTQL
jgi:hypothetical protein